MDKPARRNDDAAIMSQATRAPRLLPVPGEPIQLVFILARGPNFIGRGADCQVTLLDPSVSRRHAVIDVSPGRVTLSDLQSRNGVFVDDLPVDAVSLKGGEHLRIGQVRLVYEQGDVAAGPARAVSEDAPPPSIVRDVSATFARVSLTEELQRRREGAQGPASAGAELAQRTQDKLRMLLEISRILSGPEAIDSLLPKILGLAFELFEASRAVILLVNEATGELEERVKRVTTERPGEPAFSRSIVKYVRDNGFAMLFEDASRDARVREAYSVVKLDIRSVMCVPLKVRERLIGVLYVDKVFKSKPYLEDDLELLSAFANQAAVAIDNAMLYRRIQEEAVLRSNLLRFFPPAAVKKLLASSGSGGGSGLGLDVIETEVTVLFSDITDFTAMSSTMRPREVVELLNSYFPVMTEIVFRHGGTLEKYIGDALLAVWGAPFRQDDDAACAVRAAIEMQTVLLGFNRHLELTGRAPLRVHIGLNTGTVAAGNIGSAAYLQYATIGDATNLASRICTAAGPDEILISASTLAKVSGLGPSVEALPPVFVKGKREPLELYRVPWRPAGA
jgi:adenylate cyclase